MDLMIFLSAPRLGELSCSWQEEVDHPTFWRSYQTVISSCRVRFLRILIMTGISTCSPVMIMMTITGIVTAGRVNFFWSLDW